MANECWSSKIQMWIGSGNEMKCFCSYSLRMRHHVPCQLMCSALANEDADVLLKRLQGMLSVFQMYFLLQKHGQIWLEMAWWFECNVLHCRGLPFWIPVEWCKSVLNPKLFRHEKVGSVVGMFYWWNDDFFSCPKVWQALFILSLSWGYH